MKEEGRAPPLPIRLPSATTPGCQLIPTSKAMFKQPVSHPYVHVSRVLYHCWQLQVARSGMNFDGGQTHPHKETLVLVDRLRGVMVWLGDEQVGLT